jgi:hypothetical protein
MAIRALDLFGRVTVSVIDFVIKCFIISMTKLLEAEFCPTTNKMAEMYFKHKRELKLP